MDSFNVYELLAKRDHSIHSYDEFFRTEAFSLGLAVWPAGLPDEQQPHGEDEVYYVAGGRGRIQVGDEDQEVQAGSVIFVAAGVDHHFHSIEGTLRVVVFWAPPHHSREKA